ncbi:MAG: DUF3365 domain-containing protein [Colwellia sp.]|nr:DUF3365 domain-containing protein [Colwellia sp.]
MFKKCISVSLSLFLLFSSMLAKANDQEMKRIVDQVSKMYISSMVFLFKHQWLINQKGGDKSELFSEPFINNIKRVYEEKYQEDFPKSDHIAKKMLLQSMIEVMEDNRPILTDADIGFKGIIPATFASQLGRKLAIKGIGLKIKFTRMNEGIRNKANIPDAWESAMIQKIIKVPKIYYDANAVVDGKAVYRQFTPLPMKPYCLKCHGTMADNPLNEGKDRSQWTNIDMTGFEMENWKITDFGGGVSILMEKSSLQ